MNWRDDLHRVSITVSGKTRTLIGASFRGVPFFVDESERGGGGRRFVSHEFPFRDDPYVEDLGRGARLYHVTGYVLGDDYIAQRDALLSALEDTAGPGQLLHPYYGTLIAISGPVTVRETKTDGGIATFTIQFAEAPAQVPVPIAAADASAAVADSASSAASACDAEFQQNYDPSDLPGHALVSAENALSTAGAALQTYIGPVISDTQELASLNAEASIIVAQATALALEPSVVIGQFRSVITSLENTIENAPENLMNAMIGAYSVNLGAPVTPTTPTRTQEAANQTAIQAALRRVFVVEAATLAPTVPFTTLDDALAARDSISSMIDTECEGAGDAAYGALVDLRAQLQQAVPGSAAFASVVTVTRRTPVPSLVLAYRLYGSVDLEPDILARNDVQNPSFLVGDLQVLSDGD